VRITKLSRVIGVEDMTRALAFYGEALGLSVTSANPEWAELTCGDGNLSLQNFQNPRTDGEYVPTMVLLTVEGDLDEAIAVVECAGGRLLHVSDHARSPVIVAHVGDTEGNAIQLVTLRKSA
jgi:predicted enzyme related to lactoylglutathione lyase